MKLVNENVVISVSGVLIAEIPFPVFERLATVEIADIIFNKLKENIK
jgi:hypothetical protein